MVQNWSLEGREVDHLPYSTPCRELLKYNTMLSLLDNSHVKNTVMPILETRKLKSREASKLTVFLQQITLGRKPKLKSHVRLSDSRLWPGMWPFPFCGNKWFMIRNLLVVIGEAGFTVWPGLVEWLPEVCHQEPPYTHKQKKSFCRIFS